MCLRYNRERKPVNTKLSQNTAVTVPQTGHVVMSANAGTKSVTLTSHSTHLDHGTQIRNSYDGATK